MDNMRFLSRGEQMLNQKEQQKTDKNDKCDKSMFWRQMHCDNKMLIRDNTRMSDNAYHKTSQSSSH